MIVLVLLSMLRISLLVRYLSTITFLQHANKEHYSTQILSLINCLSLAGVTQLHNSTLDKCRDVLLILIFTQHTTEYYLGSYFSLSLAGCLAELKQYLVIIIPRGLKLLYTLAVGVKVLRGPQKYPARCCSSLGPKLSSSRASNPSQGAAGSVGHKCLA